MIQTNLTQEILTELLHYDPKTGVFTWKARDRKWFKSDRACKFWNTSFAGKTAGHTGSRGYRIVNLLGSPRRAHRLAFLYMTGAFPPASTDHINQVKDDNRWTNLRQATQLENMQNTKMRRDNKSGYSGVNWNIGVRKWLSTIKVARKSIYLGIFDEFEDAVAAREAANVKYGFHPNHGRPQVMEN